MTDILETALVCGIAVLFFELSLRALGARIASWREFGANIRGLHAALGPLHTNDVRSLLGAGMSDRTVYRWLKRLADRRILQRRPDGRWEPYHEKDEHRACKGARSTEEEAGDRAQSTTGAHRRPEEEDAEEGRPDDVWPYRFKDP